jgi:protein SCO1/2
MSTAPSSPSPAPPTGGSAAPRGLAGKRLLLGLLGLLLLIVVGAIVIPTLASRGAIPPLPVEGQVPDFRLIDDTGAVVTAESLRGHVTIVDFVFTRCDTICPTLSAKMRRVQDQTADVGDAVKIVSFSVDPEYDQPDILAAYADQFGADERRWRFVTSPNRTRADLEPIAEAFMVTMDRVAGERPGGAPNIWHSSYFFLVDQDLRIRGFYDSNDGPRVEKMLNHARQLVRQGAGPRAAAR